MGYNSIKMYGNQICDYVHLQSTEVNNDDVKTVQSEPTTWGGSTVMLSKFNKDLSGGNSAMLESIVGYEIRRKKGNESHTTHIGTIQNSDETNDKKFVIDYSVSNDCDYTYYLYPSLSSEGYLSPLVTKRTHTDWSYWSLLIVDESDVENVFYLNKMFKFELNLKEGDMNNNAVININQNFTKYPTVQYGMSNYWSGSLSALCGFISCSDTEYIQTPNMIEEIKALSSDTRRKFLKNTAGDIWEVTVSTPINLSTEMTAMKDLKTLNFSWCEVGEATDISIINNPNMATTNWLLTETGEVVPYIDYIWDEHYVWDDTYKWTAKNETLKTELSNMGRSIHDKNGGESL